MVRDKCIGLYDRCFVTALGNGADFGRTVGTFARAVVSVG